MLADKVYYDFVRKGHEYVPFASLPDRDVIDNRITFNANSKTFDLAGMKKAYLYINNSVPKGHIQQNRRTDVNILGLVANEAGYREGREWFDHAMRYIDAKHDLVEYYFREDTPMVGYKCAGTTFLNRLDFSLVKAVFDAGNIALERGYATPQDCFQDWLVEPSGVLRNPGSDYGAGGARHMRMNITSARLVVEGAGIHGDGVAA